MLQKKQDILCGLEPFDLFFLENFFVGCISEIIDFIIYSVIFCVFFFLQKQGQKFLGLPQI